MVYQRRYCCGVAATVSQQFPQALVRINDLAEDLIELEDGYPHPAHFCPRDAEFAISIGSYCVIIPHYGESQRRDER